MEDRGAPGRRGQHVHHVPVGGKEVTAILDMGPEERSIAPPHWNAYIRVNDAEAGMARARELGAAVHGDPFDVMDAGRVVTISDPSGARVALWEPEALIGARLVNEAGAWTWSDLGTRDPEKAERFYTELFGGTLNQVVEGSWLISMGDLLVGGMRRMEEEEPKEIFPIPPRWPSSPTTCPSPTLWRGTSRE